MPDNAISPCICPFSRRWLPLRHAAQLRSRLCPRYQVSQRCGPDDPHVRSSQHELSSTGEVVKHIILLYSLYATTLEIFAILFM